MKLPLEERSAVRLLLLLEWNNRGFPHGSWICEDFLVTVTAIEAGTRHFWRLLVEGYKGQTLIFYYTQ